jgi:hypothetical protein
VTVRLAQRNHSHDEDGEADADHEDAGDAFPLPSPRDLPGNPAMLDVLRVQFP